jgi:hypothetical protein
MPATGKTERGRIMSEQQPEQTTHPDDGSPLIADEWRLRMIDEGLRSVDQGRVVPHEAVLAILNKKFKRDAA